LLMKE